MATVRTLEMQGRCREIYVKGLSPHTKVLKRKTWVSFRGYHGGFTKLTGRVPHPAPKIYWLREDVYVNPDGTACLALTEHVHGIILGDTQVKFGLRAAEDCDVENCGDRLVGRSS